MFSGNIHEKVWVYIILSSTLYRGWNLQWLYLKTYIILHTKFSAYLKVWMKHGHSCYCKCTDLTIVCFILRQSLLHGVMWFVRSRQSSPRPSQVSREGFQYIQPAWRTELSTTLSSTCTSNIPISLHVYAYCSQYLGYAMYIINHVVLKIIFKINFVFVVLYFFLIYKCNLLHVSTEDYGFYRTNSNEV